MMVVLEVPWVPRALVRALEVSHKDLLQIRPTLDHVGRQVFKPRSCRIGQEQWKVVDNEVVIIRTTGLTGKPIVFKPKPGVCLPRVLRDVGRWSIPWWEGRVEDVTAEGLRAWQAGARASVLAAIVASAMTRVVAMASLLPRIATGTPAGIEGVMCVAVVAKSLMY